MLYELRIYQVAPGRLQAILDRFNEDTIDLFAKHNMKVTNFWVDADESKDRLYYVLEHPDMAARERNFEAFMADPEWHKVIERTEQDGQLHESIEVVYMNKAAFFQG
ncbi:NIPSNAP family protein [Paenibacillus sp. R14(2021)]|uniref:NIPSNAP family protein n=1 Tax=Paenibacillus sp. R14(2021) TaxID=2859228 RepID=UPI001C612FF6|nr:NIPSNAP family protein [Paenibacillus sp. R14(2021)]